MTSNYLKSTLYAPQEMKTYYASFFDRITGGYTVEWMHKGKTHKIKSHVRFKDFEGFAPPLKSYFNLPKAYSTFKQAQNHPILPSPIPFLVFEAIEYLDSIIKPGMRILEVGGGNSSLWFLSKGCKVTTIEHSKDWAEFIMDFATQNKSAYDPEAFEAFDIKVTEGEEAIDFIKNCPDGHFDMILVDCMNAFTSRNDCITEGFHKVKTGGWVILDNSDHPQNWKSVESLRDLNRVRFTGYAPMGLIITQTSFWQKK